MADLDQAAARRWIDRWDAQQQRYMQDREERFTAVIDAVEAGAGRQRPTRCWPALPPSVTGAG